MSSLRRSDGAQIEQLGKFVIQHSLDAILLMQPEGRILMANPAACGLLGYTESQLVASGNGLMVPELNALLKACDADGEGSREHWISCGDGRRRCVEVTSSTVSHDDETWVAVILRDVNRWRHYDHDRRLIEAAMADAPVAIAVLDSAWHLVWGNKTLEDITGYTLAELVGRKSPVRRFLEERAPEPLAEIEHALQSQGKWRGEVYSRRRNGAIYPLYGTISAVQEPLPGQGHIITTLADVSRLRDYERQLQKLSRTDPVTGLTNRAFFEQGAKEALERAKREGSGLSLTLMNIDGFRAVNETWGYSHGDYVLSKVGARIKTAVVDGAILSRLPSGFALLVLGGPEEAAVQFARIRSSLKKPIVQNDNRVTLSMSAGIGCYPEDGATLDTLLTCAEAALRKTKDGGGDDYSFYEKGLEERSRNFMRLTTPIREALADEEFVAYFQPILDASSFRIVSMEALARWPRSDGTLVSPTEFIPVAERSDAIAHLARSILRQTCQHLRRLDALGGCGLRLSASVNLSARQFREPGLAERFLRILREEGVDPERIGVEITESLLMDRPEEKNRELTALQRAGVRIIIDDFGTGYSSFAYLKKFPVDGIKLDRDFIKDVPGDSRNEKLVSMMVAVGKALDIPVVAEGVERREQVAFLRARGCSRLQGYLFAPALPADEFADRVKAMQGSGRAWRPEFGKA